MDLESGCLRLPLVEEGDAREFPLTSGLREVLAKQIEETGRFELLTGKDVPWLFHRNGRTIKNFRKAWAVACQRAGVQGRVPGNLRRRQFAISNMPESRVQLRWPWSDTARITSVGASLL